MIACRFIEVDGAVFHARFPMAGGNVLTGRIVLEAVNSDRSFCRHIPATERITVGRAPRALRKAFNEHLRRMSAPHG